MKICSVCNKKLTFKDSFTWENQPICKTCLQAKTDISNSTIRNRKHFSDLPSWVLALFVSLVSFLIVMFLGYLLIDVLNNENVALGIAYIIYDIIITIACFFICRNNPKSIWYVPILCNIPGIISALVEPNFWITSMWMVFCGGWVLSIIAAILGAKAGKRSAVNTSE
jgi:hypothetical protein